MVEYDAPMHGQKSIKKVEEQIVGDLRALRVRARRALKRRAYDNSYGRFAEPEYLCGEAIKIVRDNFTGLKK